MNQKAVNLHNTMDVKHDQLRLRIHDHSLNTIQANKIANQVVSALDNMNVKNGASELNMNIIRTAVDANSNYQHPGGGGTQDTSNVDQAIVDRQLAELNLDHGSISEAERQEIYDL